MSGNLKMEEKQQDDNQDDNQTTKSKDLENAVLNRTRSKPLTEEKFWWRAKIACIIGEMKMVAKWIRDDANFAFLQPILLCGAYLMFAAFYIDFAFDIATVIEYYNNSEKIGSFYWIIQILTLVIPPLIMTVYWAWETKKDTKIRRFMAIVPLGIFYEIFFPIAALLHLYPCLKGHEASEPDVGRVVRLTTVQVFFENLPQSILSWMYLQTTGYPWQQGDLTVGQQVLNWAPFIVGITSLMSLTCQSAALAVAWYSFKKKKDEDIEESAQALNA